MTLLQDILDTGLTTVTDILPIAVIIFGFRLLVLRQSVVGLGKIIAGFAYVLIGLTLFLVGLQEALFPVGRAMAQQLTAQVFAGNAGHSTPGWSGYLWVYLFAAAIGFATTIAEPALIAVAYKARQVSAGAIHTRGLRVAVAIGVAAGITLGVFRIVSGTPLHWYIIAGYLLILLQTLFAPRMIVALAYDSGGVTTSTVTVPLVAALGLGLAGNIPGRSPLLDGFGLIAFASLFPIMSVLAYAQLGSWWLGRSQRNTPEQP
jgi:hypothetical protein